MAEQNQQQGGFRAWLTGLIDRVKKALDFRKMSLTQALFTIAFIVIVGIMIFLYAYTFLVDKTLLTEIIIRGFVVPVMSLPEWGGIILYFGIMMLQCVVAPIPSELVQVVGGLMFGFGLGAFLSLIGIMITSFIGYTIAVKGGAPVISAAIGEENVAAMERFISKYGIWAMIIGRGIPVIPFDLMTYGAGLVKMHKRDFVLGTLIGTIPRSIFYAYIGSILFPGGVSQIMTAYNAGTLEFDTMLESVSGNFNLILTLTIVVIGLGFALFQFVILPRMRRDAAAEANLAKETSN